MLAERSLVYRISAMGRSEAVSELRSFQQTYLQIAQEMAKQETALAKSVEKNRADALKRGSEEASKILRESLKRQSKDEADAAKKNSEYFVTSYREVYAKKAKEAEKSAKDETRVAERESKARERMEDDVARRAKASREQEIRAFEDAERRKTRAVEIEAQRRATLLQGLGSAISKGGIQAGRTMVSGAMGLASEIGRGLGINDAFDVQGIVKQQFDIKKLLRAVAIEARTAGGTSTFNEDAAFDKIRATSKATGLSQNDLAAAIDVYSEKGSGQTAVENIDRIAKQATAMNTSAAVVAKLRAQMGISSAVTGKELSEDEKDALIARMHFVGKTGVFRAEDMAVQSEELFSEFAKSGGDFRTDFNKFLSFANEARKATGSGAQARTAINAVQDSIAKKAGKISALGVKTTDSEGNARNFVDVVEDIIQKTGGEGDAFNKIFEPARSGKAVSTLVTAFRSAGGGAAGRGAMDKLLEGDASLKNASVSEMYKDAASAMESEPAKMARAVEEIRQSIAETLAPAIKKFAEMVPELVDGAKKLFGFVKEHPIAAGAIAFGGLTAKNALPGIAQAIGGYFGAGGQAIGNAIGAAASTPVFVTNWPGGGIGGIGGGGGALGGLGGLGGAGVGGVQSLFAAIAPYAVAAIAGAAIVGGGAYLIAQAQKDPEKTYKEMKDFEEFDELKKNRLTPQKLIEEGFTLEDDPGGRTGKKSGKEVVDKIFDDAFLGKGGVKLTGGPAAFDLPGGINEQAQQSAAVSHALANLSLGVGGKDGSATLAGIGHGAEQKALDKALKDLHATVTITKKQLADLGDVAARVKSNISAVSPPTPSLYRSLF